MAERRSALVTGSNRARAMNKGEPRNVGLEVADKLDSLGYAVLDPPFVDLDVTVDRDWSDFFGSFSDVDTLVLAHTYDLRGGSLTFDSTDVWRIVAHNLLGTIKAVKHFYQNTVQLDRLKEIIFVCRNGGSDVFSASTFGVHRYALELVKQLWREGYAVMMLTCAPNCSPTQVAKAVDRLPLGRGPTMNVQEIYC